MDSGSPRAACCTWVYYVVLLRGYRKGDLTVVDPLARGSGPLLSSRTAFVLLGEHSDGAHLAGIATVVAGVSCGGGPRLFGRRMTRATAATLHAGLRYGF